MRKQSSQSMESMDSCASGIISDACMSQQTKQSMQQGYNNRGIRVDLNTAEMSEQLPEDTRKIFITSKDTTVQLSKMNPFAVAKGIDMLCGPVEKVEHTKSGSLLITTKTLQQIRTILRAEVFTEKRIPITTIIAWSSQISQGRIYAPEFRDCSLADLLELLKPSNVIGIRKLYSDPNKSTSPLYVLSFLSKECPERIKTGYTSYRVDPYFPGPTRCTKCCRWDHSAAFCKSLPVCNKCGKKGHMQANCPSQVAKCANCGEQHLATSKECPAYIAAKEVCKVKAKFRVTYGEARQMIRERERGPGFMQESELAGTNTPITVTQESFPALSSSRRDCTRNSEVLQSSGISSLDQRYNGRAPCSENDSSQSSAWITAGQRRVNSIRQPTGERDTRRKSDKYAYSNLEVFSQNNIQQSLPELDLPPLTQTSQVDGGGRSVRVPSGIERESVNSGKSSIKELLSSLIPILVKLFLAKGITEKIESFIEIGSVFQLEEEINDILSKIGLSSVNSQTN